MKLSTNKKGDIGELNISLYYLNKGYEVCRNVTSDGIVDLIVYKPETKETLLIDVKVAIFCNINMADRYGWTVKALSKHQINHGIIRAIYFEGTNICIKNIIPPRTSNLYASTLKEYLSKNDYDKLNLFTKTIHNSDWCETGKGSGTMYRKRKEIK